MINGEVATASSQAFAQLVGRNVETTLLGAFNDFWKTARVRDAGKLRWLGRLGALALALTRLRLSSGSPRDPAKAPRSCPTGRLSRLRAHSGPSCPRRSSRRTPSAYVSFFAHSLFWWFFVPP